MPFLSKKRAEGIIKSLLKPGGWFQCHKTLNSGRAKQYCAGSMILLEKVGQPTQWMQVSERMGWGYDHKKLDMSAPVFNTFNEFIQAQCH